MNQAVLAQILATSLAPLLRHTAHQLTLCGLVQDEGDFSNTWLGSELAYQRFHGFDLMQLGGLVHSLEFGLGLQQCVFEDAWEQAHSDRDRWQTKVKLAAVRALRAKLRVWSRQNSWQGLRPD